MEPVRGVVFDLFHTLTARESEWSDLPATCDLLGTDRRSWDRILLESSRWRIVGEVRDPWEIVRRLAHLVDASMPEERIRRVLDVRTRRFAQVFERIPPANVDAIRGLRARGLQVALLSNADALEIAAYRGSPLAGLLDPEVFSCEVGFAKPDPEIFALCLQRMGLPAAECVFVGDGGSDELRAAREAGMRTVFVSGVIEELWPEKIPERAALAHHHVKWAHQVPALLGLAETEAA